MRYSHVKTKLFYSALNKSLNGIPLDKPEENNIKKHFQDNSILINFVNEHGFKRSQGGDVPDKSRAEL